MFRCFFSRSYQIAELSSKEQRIFYANALQGLYQNAIILYLRHHVELASLPISRELSTRLVDFLLNQAPVDFMLADLHPLRAREVLENWSPAQELTYLLSLFPQLSQRGTQWTLTDLIPRKNGRQLDDPAQRIALEKLSDKRRRLNCCLNQPGCLFCPSNRGFLIPSQKD